MILEKTCPEEMIHFTCCSETNLTSFTGSKILQIWHELPKLVITSLTNAWITMYTAVAIALLCLFYCVGLKAFMTYIDWSSKTLYMLGPFNKIWFLFSNHELHLQNWKKIVLAWVPQGIYWYTIIFVMIAFKNLMHLLTIIIYYKNCCQLGQHSSNHTLFTGSLVIMGFQYLSSCPHFWKLPLGLEPSEVLSWRLPGDGVLLYSSK